MTVISLDEGSLDDVFVVTRVGDAEGNAFGRQVRYWCEACGYIKQIAVKPYTGPGASWTWNGCARLPVLAPSQMHRTYMYPRQGTPEQRAEADRLMERKDNREAMMKHSVFGRQCHTFIGREGAPPGHVIFLGDCLHKIRGVRPLLPRHAWPEDWAWAARRSNA